MSIKKDKIIYHPILEGYSTGDKIMYFIIKPMIIAGMYSLDKISSYVLRKSGRKSSIHSQILQEATTRCFKKSDRNKLTHCYMSWLTNSLGAFTDLDNAYDILIRKFFSNYYAICEERGYKLYRVKKHKIKITKEELNKFDTI